MTKAVPAPNPSAPSQAAPELVGESLTKLYGTTRALLDVSLSFRAGEVTVVEGSNGSGKSTLLSLLAGLAKPTEGRITFGGVPAGDRLRGDIGMVAHEAMLYPDLTGAENLGLYGSLYGVTNLEARVEELRERFAVGRFGERPVRTYSRGQVQRVALCRALLHAPRILLLDEPSNGLDAASVALLEEAIAAERARGALAVLVTHDQGLATRVADVRVRLASGRVASRERIRGGVEAGGDA